MRRGSNVLIALAALLGMGVAAWILVGPHLRRETVTIVSLLPRCGSAKPQTDAIVLGIRLALEEHDHRAGRFKVRHEDWDYFSAAGSSGARAEELARQAHQRPDVLALIGARDSASTFRILAFLGRLEPSLLVISPASTLGELTEHNRFRDEAPAGEGDPGPALFRTLPARPLQGALAARWAKREGMKRVHLYLEDRDSEYLIAFREEARREELLVTESAEAYPSEMARIQAVERPDLIFMGGRDPMVTADVIGFLRLAGYGGKVLLGSGELEPLLLKELGETSGVYVTDSTAAPPDDFARRATTGDPYAYYGYLAAKAAIQAIAGADSKDKTDVLRACARLPMFDSQGEIAQPSIDLFQVKAGRFELVEVLR